MTPTQIAEELSIPVQTVNNVILGRKIIVDNVLKSRILKLNNK